MELQSFPMTFDCECHAYGLNSLQMYLIYFCGSSATADNALTDRLSISVKTTIKSCHSL